MNVPNHSAKLAEFTVGVDNVIFSVDLSQNQLLVLLIRRNEAPSLGEWCLPGTLVRRGETLEAAAYRILAEKIQVQNLYLEQLYTFAEPDNIRLGGDRYLCVSYFALVRRREANLVQAGSDPAIVWHPVDRVPPLAFNHNAILAYGYKRLRNKMEYSPVAFDVLPELFTLSDLYQLYAAILGEQFSDYSNFRSRLLKLGFLEDTGKKVSKGAGRPAALYRFDREAFAPYKDKPLVFV